MASRLKFLGNVSKSEMRKYLASISFTACALATYPAQRATAAPEGEAVAPELAVQQAHLPLPVLRDEAAMVIVGTALIGLAAVVRRAA